MTPFAETFIAVPDVYFNKLRNIEADEVVIDCTPEVETIENVKVGPTTPLIVVVGEPPEESVQVIEVGLVLDTVRTCPGVPPEQILVPPEYPGKQAALVTPPKIPNNPIKKGRDKTSFE